MSRIQPVISDDVCPLPLSGLSCLCPAIEGVGLSHAAYLTSPLSLSQPALTNADFEKKNLRKVLSR